MSCHRPKFLSRNTHLVQTVTIMLDSEICIVEKNMLYYHLRRPQSEIVLKTIVYTFASERIEKSTLKLAQLQRSSNQLLQITKFIDFFGLKWLLHYTNLHSYNDSRV